MILLDQENNETNIAEQNENDKSPSERIIEVLAAFTAQAKLADKNSKIMSWKTMENFSYMAEEFPSDVAEVAVHLERISKQIKGYICV